jgi:hypothetical protein
VSAVPRFPHQRTTRATTGARMRRVVLIALASAGFFTRIAFCTNLAGADVDDVGPPPSEPEIRQTLIDTFSRGQPLGNVVNVEFDGPIMVGAVTAHDKAGDPSVPTCQAQGKINPYRCKQYELVSAPMYPVFALVRVSVYQDLQASSVTASIPYESTTTHAGATCVPHGDCAFYFYRDGQGNWQVV